MPKTLTDVASDVIMDMPASERRTLKKRKEESFYHRENERLIVERIESDFGGFQWDISRGTIGGSKVG